MKLPLTIAIAALLAVASGAGYFILSEQGSAAINVADSIPLTETEHEEELEDDLPAAALTRSTPEASTRRDKPKMSSLEGVVSLRLPENPNANVSLTFTGSSKELATYNATSNSKGAVQHAFASHFSHLEIAVEGRQIIKHDLPQIERAGQVVDLGEFRPLPLYTYQGTVLRNDGNAIARAHLFLTMGSMQELYACTSFDGSFHFEDMVPETFRGESKQTFNLEVRHSFFAPQLIKIRVDKGTVTGPSEVVLTPGGTIAGLIDLSERSGNPKHQQGFATASIKLNHSQSYDSVLTRTVDVDIQSGSFRTERLPPGLYTVEVKWRGRTIASDYKVQVEDFRVNDLRMTTEQTEPSSPRKNMNKPKSRASVDSQLRKDQVEALNREAEAKLAEVESIDDPALKMKKLAEAMGSNAESIDHLTRLLEEQQ